MMKSNKYTESLTCNIFIDRQSTDEPVLKNVWREFIQFRFLVQFHLSAVRTSHLEI